MVGMVGMVVVMVGGEGWRWVAAEVSSRRKGSDDDDDDDDVEQQQQQTKFYRTFLLAVPYAYTHHAYTQLPTHSLLPSACSSASSGGEAG